MGYALINLGATADEIRHYRAAGANLFLGIYEYAEFDAVPESTQRQSAAVTQHPVEAGSDVVDNVRAEPRDLELLAVISNRPASFLDWASRSGTYAQDVYEQLNLWLQYGTLLTVVAVDTVYEDMAIVSIDRGHDHTKGEAVHVRLALKEIFIVSTETTDAPKPSTARATRTQSQGQKGTKASSESNSTIAADIVDALAG